MKLGSNVILGSFLGCGWHGLIQNGIYAYIINIPGLGCRVGSGTGGNMQRSRILVVDDDPSIRKFVKANLEARNYEVIMAVDGDEAIQKVEEEQLDLVLLDIMMPQLDGLAVCRRIREKSKIPIMIISARDSEDDTVRCLDSGADDYLTKPFSLKELLARIKAILRNPS
jgi:two-component system, OmpR family, response regulator VicR